MKVSELESGLYKVRIQSPPPLIKRDRNVPTPTVHLLQVKGHGEKRTYQLDGNMPADRQHFLIDEAELEILKKIKHPVLNRTAIHLTWKDEDGDDFALTTSDAWTLKNLFEDFSFLQQAFNYRPRKK